MCRCRFGGPICETAGRHAVETGNGGGGDDLGFLVDVFLLVTCVQEIEEGDGRVKYARGVDVKGIGEVRYRCLPEVFLQFGEGGFGIFREASERGAEDAGIAD